MGADGGGWGRRAGEEVACKEEILEIIYDLPVGFPTNNIISQRLGGRREGEEEMGRGGYKCGGRGERRGRVMKRHPGKSSTARMYGLKYVSFTTSIARS